MTSQGIHKPTSRALTTFVAGLALAVVAMFAGVSPASAHDELISTAPSSGATIDVLPDALTLTFSAYIAPDAGASEVAVTDAAGTSLTAGDPEVNGAVLTQPLEGAASGVITVLWKVVSSDGHPISGQYAFTVTGAATPTESAAPTPTEEATPSATADVATPEASESAVVEDPNMEAVDMRPWFIGAIVLLIAVAGAVLYLMVSRRRRDQAITDADSARTNGRNADSDTPSEG